jgi:hypothetical protein
MPIDVSVGVVDDSCCGSSLAWRRDTPLLAGGEDIVAGGCLHMKVLVLVLVLVVKDDDGG